MAAMCRSSVPQQPPSTYEDASFFGRLFRRKVGLTPAQYHRRFGSLRRALRG